MNDTEALVEKIARAICAAQNVEQGAANFDLRSHRYQAECRYLARAALAAIEGSGTHRVVQTVTRLPVRHTASTNNKSDPAVDTKGAKSFISAHYGEHISIQTLRKLRCIGGGPRFFKGIGNRVFYRESAIREWVESKRTPELRVSAESAFPAARPRITGETK